MMRLYPRFRYPFSNTQFHPLAFMHFSGRQFCNLLISWPFTFEFCNLLISWPFTLEFCNLLISWPFTLEFCNLLISWPFTLEFCNLLISWPFTLEFCNRNCKAFSFGWKSLIMNDWCLWQNERGFNCKQNVYYGKVFSLTIWYYLGIVCQETLYNYIGPTANLRNALLVKK
jgi:hypothetical protein